MSLLQRMFPWVGKSAPPALIVPPSVDTTAPNESAPITSERGYRTTPENAVKYAYRLMWVDPDIRQAILDVREMDRIDGRVKKIHGRVARDIIRGGLVFPTENQTLRREWDAFTRRLQLNFAEKLKSDARGIVMEGNLPMQWVIDTTFSVVAGVRMASETIMPNVGQSGQYKDAAEAHWQIDVMTGTVLAKFPLWQLFMARFDPDNHDDFGSMGRPYLDAARTRRRCAWRTCSRARRRNSSMSTAPRSSATSTRSPPTTTSTRRAVSTRSPATATWTRWPTWCISWTAFSRDRRRRRG